MAKGADNGKAEDGDQGRDLVAVEYNSDQVEIHRGDYTVEELRELLKVPENEVLAQWLDGQFKDLTTGRVVIKGGEIFAAHKPQGGAA